MTKTFIAEFKGFTATRRTEAEYAFATYRDGKVAFHGTATAARRRGGEMVVVTHVGTKAVPVGTPMREAETGTVPTGCTVRVAGFKDCGAPVVVTFKGTGGRVYGECATHKMG